MKFLKSGIITTALILSTTTNAATVTWDVNLSTDNFLGGTVTGTFVVDDSSGSNIISSMDVMMSNFHYWTGWEYVYLGDWSFTGSPTLTGNSNGYSYWISTMDVENAETDTWNQAKFNLFRELDALTFLDSAFTNDTYAISELGAHTQVCYPWSCQTGLGTLGGTLTRVSSVPVPAAVWLFGSGLIGLVGLSRRKKV